MNDHEKTDYALNAHLRGLSVNDFMALGVRQIAYVKPIALDDRVAFVVHAADGTPLSVHDEMREAYTAVRSSELHSVTLQ